MRHSPLLALVAAVALADEAPTRFEQLAAPASAAFLKGRFAESERLSRRCLEIDDDLVIIDPCVTMLALSLRRSGRLAPMVEGWRRSVDAAASKERWRALAGLTAEAIDRGDFDGAAAWVAHLVDAAAKKPRLTSLDLHAWDILAFLHLQRNKMDEFRAVKQQLAARTVNIPRPVVETFPNDDLIGWFAFQANLAWNEATEQPDNALRRLQYLEKEMRRYFGSKHALVASAFELQARILDKGKKAQQLRQEAAAIWKRLKQGEK